MAPRYGDVSYAFGPGPATPAIKLLIIANVAAFLSLFVVPNKANVLIDLFGLQPQAVFEGFAFWQLVTYMFLHGGIGHLLINMLSLWMFGTELERMWGTRFFTKYYFVTGIGAGLTTLLWAIGPLPFADQMYATAVIGASGAVYGILLAYGMNFPHRIIYLIVFPVQAKYFVMIVGAIAFLSSVGSSGGGISHTAHLGGFLAGYLYLKGLRARPLNALRYRWVRWKMSRARNKFGVYSGGRDDDPWKSDWKKHIH
jgi:membrane associated rhomboid family serine protease